jgi:hypothetical protein
MNACVRGLPALMLASFALAQNERTVAVVVTAANDRSVYLDHGRDIGLAVGMYVRLFPPGAGELEVQVRAISQTSASADLPPGLPLPPVGTSGEARVAAAPAKGNAPAHPPWVAKVEPRQPGQPLLVPTFGQRPDERPATLDGRAFLFGQWNDDRAGGGSRQYTLLRAGVRADAMNWLGAAERLRLAAEFDDRRVDVEDRPASDDQNGRIDLGSAAFGTAAHDATGIELGRFVSPHLPELGLVDGGEVVRRYQGGLRFGFGGGAYPRPFPARDAGDDVGAHAFVDYAADDARSLALAAGVQKTWHRGDPDRDLLLLRAEWRPLPRTTLQAASKVDYYRGRDALKGSGFELTELLVAARHDGDRFGIGVTGSRFTWPELLRAEYQELPPELVRDGFVDRLGLSLSWRVHTNWSLRGRADVWRDQDRDGQTFGLDADWREPWSATSAVSLALFHNEGGFSRGPGARLALRERLGSLSLRAGYRWHRYELTELLTGPDELLRQSVELGVGCPLGGGGDLDLSCERWFGDREDAFAVGFYLQWRF